MTLLEVTNLQKHYAGPGKKSLIRAVDGVDFTLGKGQTLGVVGESGCGKSTLARLILRLVEPSAGHILFEGQDLLALNPAQMRAMRRNIQIVFQDPYASLDPRMRIAEAISEPLDIHGIGSREERRKSVMALLDRVGLPANAAERYPHEFSGGQRQRIGIARALALRPRLLILDEPVSALDVSIQAQVLNLLQELKDEFSLTYIFISHDLSVVEHIADEVAVMYLGRIVEKGPAGKVFRKPGHPYTEALVSAVPNPDPRKAKGRIILGGDPPNPASIPTGCRFHPRCFAAKPLCQTASPENWVGGKRQVACHFAGERLG